MYCFLTCDTMSDESGSEAESAPPPPAGVAVPAAAHHPVWRRAAGAKAPSVASSKGSGGKKKANRNAPVADTTPPTFGPISLNALGMRLRAEGDGASSCGGEETAVVKLHKKPPPKRQKGVEYEDSGDDAEADIACNVFGGGRGGIADDESVCSEATSARSTAPPMFTAGIACVGCSAPGRIALIDTFVRENAASMAEVSLFKLAALRYETSVRGPALAEGVSAPAWNWKALREHYVFHAVDARSQRLSNIRSLASLKSILEMSVMRRDAATGEETLDPHNSQLLLKVLSQHSREIGLLNEVAQSTAQPKKK